MEQIQQTNVQKNVQASVQASVKPNTSLTIKTEILMQKLFSIPPMEKEFTTDKDGNEKIIQPSQAEVAEHILAHFADLVKRYDKDVFFYNGTHWIEWKDEEKRRLSKAITDLYEGKTGVGRVKQIEEFVMKLMPSFSTNPYIQNPFIANFQDGVLEANQVGDTFKLNFREHRPEDNCLYVLPMNYKVDRSIKNQEFLKMLETTTGGDKEKIRQIKQMYGVILMPIFPHLFLNVGPGGTGKSSIIKCAMKLRNQDSMSFSDPTSWGESFGMEPMLGKLVNVDLDIETHKPLADSIVKKIEDRHLFSINRKNKRILNAPIPAVHVFGANKIPPTLEWGTKAHDRRWTFIKYDSFQGHDNSDRDFSIRAFNSCPEGVLNFALEGLIDLIEHKGKFHQSAESKQMIEEWQLANDPFGQFIKELKEEENGIETDTKGIFLVISSKKDAKVKRSKLWKTFSNWYEATYNKSATMGKNKFFNYMEQQGFSLTKSDGDWCFNGFESGTTLVLKTGQ